jgi:hypothetical protein
MIFRTTLLPTGKTAAGIVVPAEIVDALAAGHRPRVRVTINNHTYRSTIAVRGGQYLLGVSAENRRAAGIQPGDEIDIELAVDSEPRHATVPSELANALDDQPEARTRFDALSYSAQQRLTLPIENARTPQTRQRRVEAALHALRNPADSP